MKTNRARVGTRSRLAAAGACLTLAACASGQSILQAGNNATTTSVGATGPDATFGAPTTIQLFPQENGAVASTIQMGAPTTIQIGAPRIKMSAARIRFRNSGQSSPSPSSEVTPGFTIVIYEALQGPANAMSG